MYHLIQSTLESSSKIFPVVRILYQPDKRKIVTLVMFKPVDARGNAPIHLLEEDHAKEEIYKHLLRTPEVYKTHATVLTPEKPNLELYFQEC